MGLRVKRSQATWCAMVLLVMDNVIQWPPIEDFEWAVGLSPAVM